MPVSDFTRDELHRGVSRTQGLLTSRTEYDRLGRIRQRDVFSGNAQRPAPRRWSRRWEYDWRNNLVREERDDNPFSWHRWRYDVHGRTTEKESAQVRWRYRYDAEHRLTEVISEPKDRNRPQVEVSFRYDPLGRRLSKTRRQTLNGQPQGKAVTTHFVWDGFRLLQEIHDGVPLTYVYSDAGSYEPLARVDSSAVVGIRLFAVSNRKRQRMKRYCQLNKAIL